MSTFFFHNVSKTLEAAFSSHELSSILSNVANKFLLNGYNAVESTWRKITAVKRANDFKPTTSYRLSGDTMYQHIAPQGEIKHGYYGEEAFINKIDTYGRILGISRQDIINDDMGALTTGPRLLGRGAALKMNEIFWGMFLDHVDFFKVDNNNLLTGTDSALSIDGLTNAETAFHEMLDSDGNPLGIEPRLLLVPNQLSATASQLMTAQEIRINGAKGENGYGTQNPHKGRFEVLRSTYLTKTDSPQTSETAWYMLADPQDLAVIEAAFLNGNETPTIESAAADFNTLGIQMRGFHDFGIALQDPRAAMKSTGE